MTVRSIKHFYIPNWVLALGEAFGLSHAQLLDSELLSNKLSQPDFIKYLKASQAAELLGAIGKDLTLPDVSIRPETVTGFPGQGNSIGSLMHSPLQDFVGYVKNAKEAFDVTLAEEHERLLERIKPVDEDEPRSTTYCFTSVWLIGQAELGFTLKFYTKEDISLLLADIDSTVQTYIDLGFTDDEIWCSPLGHYITRLFIMIDQH